MRALIAGMGLGLAVSLSGQNPPVTVAIDASAGRHPINPLIYGVAYAPDAATLANLNAPANRLGGNPTSRYNWQSNVDNRCADYYFESIPYPSATAGEVGDTFIATSRAGGALPLVTIPMLGWVAKPGPGRSKLASFSIAKYGPQTDNDWQWFPDAGNGIHLDGTFVTNDPNDADVPADSLFQQAWVQHLVTTWGSASAGGLSFYLLDNEPSIWFSSHRDVHPVGPTMDEVRNKTVDYATKIKAIDPSALVLGPEEWGWDGYFYSGYDQQYAPAHGWVFPDRIAHGGADYLPWYLGQLRDASSAAGRRLLDYFSVHYYPQGGEFSNDTSMATQLLRNRSTRSLWDPAYVDESWINDTVQLVPRLKSWVASNYPGTRVALTEYNWGAENHINGGTAQADILGILGREGVDLATRWTTPASGSPAYRAIQMYRNYDGNRSTFGQTSVQAQAPDPDSLSAFAALRADGALTVLVVSKVLSGTTPLTVALSGFSAGGPAQVWQLTSTNVIGRLADVAVVGGAVSTSVPPQSMSLFVIPAAGTGFYTLTPCRVFDTRNPDGAYGGPALSGANERVFVLAGQCNIPPTATAVSANLAVTNQTAVGHITIHPPGTAMPVVSAVNFNPLQTRANNAILPLGAAGDIAVYCGMGVGQTVQVILDVNGYFQ